jgi:hypothetical protein
MGWRDMAWLNGTASPVVACVMIDPSPPGHCPTGAIIPAIAAKGQTLCATNG